jgi:hypothetical protein
LDDQKSRRNSPSFFAARIYRKMKALAGKSVGATAGGWFDYGSGY